MREKGLSADLKTLEMPAGDGVVPCCMRVLEQARQEKIVAVASAYVNSDGTVGLEVPVNHDILRLLAAVRLMEHAILERVAAKQRR